MPEISDERLARFEAIEEASRGLEGWRNNGVEPDKPWESLAEALKPVHTPLVSDTEIMREWGSVAMGNDDLMAARRRIGALYLRKAAHKMDKSGRPGSGGFLREWADEETS